MSVKKKAKKNNLVKKHVVLFDDEPEYLFFLKEFLSENEIDLTPLSDFHKLSKFEIGKAEKSNNYFYLIDLNVSSRPMHECFIGAIKQISESGQVARKEGLVALYYLLEKGINISQLAFFSNYTEKLQALGARSDMKIFVKKQETLESKPFLEFLSINHL